MLVLFTYIRLYLIARNVIYNQVQAYTYVHMYIFLLNPSIVYKIDIFPYIHIKYTVSKYTEKLYFFIKMPI